MNPDISFLAFCPYCDWVDAHARAQLAALKAADRHIDTAHPRTILARRRFDEDMRATCDYNYAADTFDAIEAGALA